jgi:uncharacterized protein (DUF342 family)
MVDFVQLQQIVKDRLEQDRNIRTVTVTGSTLEEAVSEAAVLLDVPMRRLEYEVTEKGDTGFLGAGKKDWAIKAYERSIIKRQKTAGHKAHTEETIIAVPVSIDVDGEAFVHLSPDGAYLKAIPPKGRGRKATELDAHRLLSSRYVEDCDTQLVSKIIREAAGEYIKVGDFEHRSANSSMLSVDITDAEMKAYITVTPPGIGGCDISIETYLSHLRSSGVVYGVNEEYLREFSDRPIYKEREAVAEGLMSVNGQDSYIQYNFEADQAKIKLREGSNGRIDFKDLNIIKNVVENQPLAKKIPAGLGTNGKTVTGKVLPARNGRDTLLPLGKNVHAGDDGETIIADMNGQVVFAGGKVNVEPVYTVEGNVDLKTGNIIFLGTVVIKGNVEDGFSVKAAGNIEVNGTVEKAEMDAEGDIIVHQGITGKNTGTVKAGRSIWARFIENANVEAGNMVVVSDGIINSQVDAYSRIICKGKRAHIVGGRLRASEEINAKILGSPTSGTETICEVGADPNAKLQLEGLIIKKAEMEKQLEDIQLNLQTLINIKKQRKSLPEDKELYMRELMDKRQLIASDLQKNADDIAKIQNFLNAIKIRGKVSASSKVYPGVKVIIKDAVSDVHTEYKAVTFILEGNLVRVIKYEEPDESATKVPDGYTTN